MSKKKTYVAIVLDKSGSMQSTKATTVEGYNSQIREIKTNALNEQNEIYVSLVTFNQDVYEHLWNQPATELAEATTESYNPDGWTAMRDGIGYTINKLIETTDTKDEDTSYLMLIISDGMENASTHIHRAELASKIKECEATGRWTFTYLGCDKSYLQEIARETGVNMQNMAAWNSADANSAKVAYHESRKATKGYFNARSMNKNSRNYFTTDGDAADLAVYDDALLAKVNTEAATFAAEDAVVNLSFGAKQDVFQAGSNVDWSKVSKTS